MNILDEILEEIQYNNNVIDSRELQLALDLEVGAKEICIKNFESVCYEVNRNIQHVKNYFKKELSIHLTFVKSRGLVFKGKYALNYLKKILNNYLDQYVFCKKCKKHDTILSINGSLERISCNACNFITNYEKI